MRLSFYLFSAILVLSLLCGCFSAYSSQALSSGNFELAFAPEGNNPPPSPPGDPNPPPPPPPPDPFQFKFV